MPASYPPIPALSFLVWDYPGTNGYWLLMSSLGIITAIFVSYIQPTVTQTLLCATPLMWNDSDSRSFSLLFYVDSPESPDATEAEIGAISVLQLPHLKVDHTSGLTNKLATGLCFLWVSPVNLKLPKNSWPDTASLCSVVLSENTSQSSFPVQIQTVMDWRF